MSDEADESKAPLQPNLSAHDLNDDLAGASILTLLQRSAQMAEGNSQYAVDIAKDLSRQLVESKARVAELEDRVAELETEVRVYRDRSEQAEQWLNKISSELQGRVAGKLR
jgi:predicted  nucleic acid-binding Zn-ribbon protein